MYSAERVAGFAAKQGVHPGIVVGRLQHENIIKYSQMSELKAPYVWEG
jgi:HTH-type transcriptional regulator/antitoxin HigA